MAKRVILLILFLLVSWLQTAEAITLPGVDITNAVQLTYFKKTTPVTLATSVSTRVCTINGIVVSPSVQVPVLLLPGATYNYPVQLINQGNTAITVNGSINALTASWSVSFFQDSNKNGKLDVWETTTFNPSFVLDTSPNSYYLIVQVKAPAAPDTFNTTARCVIDFVTTGNAWDGPLAYQGYNALAYAGADLLTVTFNMSAARIYGISARYDVTDNTVITNSVFTNHATPYFFWDCSSDNMGFSYTISSDASVSPDNTLDLPSSDRSFHAPALTQGYFYYFKIKLQDLNGVWGTPNSFLYYYDAGTPNRVSTPTHLGFSTTSNVIQITWNAVIDNGFAGVDHYEICLGTLPGLVDVTQNLSVYGTAFSYTGINNWTYYAKVRAVDKAGNPGDWSPYSHGIFVDLTPSLNLKCRVSSTNYGDLPSNTWTQWGSPYFYWTGTTFNMGYSYSFSNDSALAPDNSIDITANFYSPGSLDSEIYYFRIKMLRAELADGTRIWSSVYTYLYNVDHDIPTPDQAPAPYARYVFNNPGKFILGVATDNYHGSGIVQYRVKIWADHGLGAVFDGPVNVSTNGQLNSSVNVSVDASGNYITFSGSDGYSYQAQYRLVDAAGNMSIYSPIGPTMSYLTSPDTDHDGILNGWELANGLNPLDPSDATADYDFDGLNNYAEYVASTNPWVNNRLMPDSDHDGIPDAVEVKYGLKPLDPSDAYDDPDNDHVPNIIEYYNGTNPKSSVDTDHDGMPDDWERAYGLNPYINDANGDLDGDGVSNWLEYQNHTYPNDYDNDGLPDWWETKYQGYNPITHGAISSKNATDSGFAEDYDGDGVPNWLEYRCGTDPTKYTDTDGDGLSDDWENIYGLNPLVADSIGDADFDGLSNLTEYAQYTDPLNPNRVPPSAPAVTINNKILEKDNFAVLTSPLTTMTGVAQPGTLIELWNINGRNQELLDRTYVDSTGHYNLKFTGKELSAALQILSIDSAGNQQAINRLVLFDVEDPKILNIRIDGAAAIGGDIISPKPTVVAQVSYYVMGLDTPNISLTLKPVSGASVSANTYHISGNILTYENNQLVFNQPTNLSQGKYDLILYVLDLAGRSATVTLSGLEVYGGASAVVGRPLNYPNPFNPNDPDPSKQNTRICYTLNDNMDITVVLYNSAAEKVWERNFNRGEEGAHAGYNEVLWSGRSDDGDEMGNGVYLFQIVGKSGGKRKVFARGKILIRRVL